MKISWQKAFTKLQRSGRKLPSILHGPRQPHLEELKAFLDFVHIRLCLLKPYCELDDYPPLEPRELLPSFEADLWEHKQLPGFSLVAFERPLNYFNEVFQFDAFQPPPSSEQDAGYTAICNRNIQLMASRLPRLMHDALRHQMAKKDISSLAGYEDLLPHLLVMDRAQVMALTPESSAASRFYLAGIYASFPSDLDTEIKRYGLRINKFKVSDNKLYESNRYFVYQHLMELYGFPMVSERRTSAALFARRLHKMGERFLVKVLGQSDRTLTTLWNNEKDLAYPKVEKIALVRLEKDQEGLELLRKGGYLIDTEKRVAIIRVRYRQHKFNADNVRQERALSVESHEIIHPLTGVPTQAVNILRESSNMFLRLNDILRGEHRGRIIYKRNEIVENTDTDEKRLKFVYALLNKSQRRIIGYGDEFFGNLSRMLDKYLHNPDNYDTFATLRDIHYDVVEKYNYIQQARKVRLLEDLRDRNVKGAKISYLTMLKEMVTHLHDLKFEIVSYFDPLVAHIISIGEGVLNDAYLRRTYIEKKEDSLTKQGLEVKKQYGRLVGLVDDFKAIRKARTDTMQRGAQSTLAAR